MRGVITYDTFCAVVDHAMSNPARPDIIIATGDLVQDETKAGYEAFRAILEKCDVPVYCIPGNHDAPSIMADVLGTAPFHVGDELQRGNWSLIMLNSFSRGDDGGRLGQNELTRLQASLQKNRSLHTLICVHHHPIPMGSRWLDGVSLRDADNFFEIVNRYSQVKGILWGHVHQESHHIIDGVEWMSTPSSCVQFKPGSKDFALSSEAPGYRHLSLYADGRIETAVHRVDHGKAEID